MNKFITWIKGLSGFMASMLKGDTAKQIVKLILSIVREVQATGKSGADKRALAFTLLVAKLPELIELAVALMKHEDKCEGDRDNDGICDNVDPCPDGPCPDLPNGKVPRSGCVLPDGTVDWDCDGKA